MLRVKNVNAMNEVAAAEDVVTEDATESVEYALEGVEDAAESIKDAVEGIKNGGGASSMIFFHLVFRICI